MTGLFGDSCHPAASEQPRIVRPLFETTRSEESKLTSRSKASNGSKTPATATSEFRAICLAMKSVPILKHLNPSLARTLKANLEILGDEDNYLKAESRACFDTLVRYRKSGFLSLAHAPYLALHPAIQRRVSSLAYQEVRGSHRGMSAARIERLREAAVSGEGAWDIGDGLSVEARFGHLVLYSPPARFEPVAAVAGATPLPPWGATLQRVEAPHPLVRSNSNDGRPEGIRSLIETLMSISLEHRSLSQEHTSREHGERRRVRCRARSRPFGLALGDATGTASCLGGTERLIPWIASSQKPESHRPCGRGSWFSRRATRSFWSRTPSFRHRPLKRDDAGSLRASVERPAWFDNT